MVSWTWKSSARRASRELSWLPATEHRGEGVFLSFSGSHRSLAPAKRSNVAASSAAGWTKWKSRHRQGSKVSVRAVTSCCTAVAPLITALSLDYGYSASALRERVYSLSAATASFVYRNVGVNPALGGLVEMGKNVGRLIEPGRWSWGGCVPTIPCAGSDPADPHEGAFYTERPVGCLLIAETSLRASQRAT